MRNLTNLLCGFALTVCGTCYATADMKDTGNMKEEKRIVQTAGRDNLVFHLIHFYNHAGKYNPPACCPSY